jgi:hypothetical protein
MQAALLPSDYYGGSATPGRHQPTAGLPATPLAVGREGQHPGASHVHHVPVGRGGAQLFPGSLATSTPQLFLVASSGTKAVTSGVAAHHAWPVLGVRCWPAHIRQVRAGSPLSGVPPLVHCTLHRPALLAGPGPSGSPGPSRRCRGCSHPPCRLPGQAAPSFNRAAATAQRWVLSPHPVTQRLVAHCLVGVDLAGPASPAAWPRANPGPCATGCCTSPRGSPAASGGLATHRPALALSPPPRGRVRPPVRAAHPGRLNPAHPTAPPPGATGRSAGRPHRHARKPAHFAKRSTSGNEGHRRVR